MKIRKEELEEQILPHFKGGDGRYIKRSFDNSDNRIMFGKLEPNSSIGYHTHSQDSETMYILSGTGTYTLEGGEEEEVHAGEVHYCPKGKGHSLKNNGKEDLNFFAVVGEHH